MRQDPRLPRGTVHRLTHDSEALVDNALGDPTRRELHVYTPPGWSADWGPLPVLVNLPGFWGSGPGQVAWRAVGKTSPSGWTA
jgi:hypothetical protein